MRGFQRFLTYLLLLLGSITFLAPLVWMISTGLKPLDQTMTMPPSWIPYRYFVEKDGVREEVKPGDKITVPSYVVAGDGEKHIVAQNTVVNGQIKEQLPSGEEKSVSVQILQQIPADENHPWTTIMSATVSNAPWEALPASAVIRKVAPRWNNFIEAIKAMKEFPRYLRNTLGALHSDGCRHGDLQRADGLRFLAHRMARAQRAVCDRPGDDDDGAVSGNDGPALLCLFRWLGWIGTLKPLWVGSFFAGAFNVFLLRQFFMTIPKDLSEAARIDGCSEFRIFWQIILPLCKPALMVVALFQFVVYVERFHRPADLFDQSGRFYAFAWPPVFPEPERRHGVALFDGGQHTRRAADHYPFLLHPEDVHRRHFDDRHQRVVASPLKMADGTVILAVDGHMKTGIYHASLDRRTLAALGLFLLGLLLMMIPLARAQSVEPLGDADACWRSAWNFLQLAKEASNSPPQESRVNMSKALEQGNAALKIRPDFFRAAALAAHCSPYPKLAQMERAIPSGTTIKIPEMRATALRLRPVSAGREHVAVSGVGRDARLRE